MELPKKVRNFSISALFWGKVAAQSRARPQIAKEEEAMCPRVDSLQ
jgi:hypothetical protein